MTTFDIPSALARRQRVQHVSRPGQRPIADAAVRQIESADRAIAVLRRADDRRQAGIEAVLAPLVEPLGVDLRDHPRARALAAELAAIAERRRKAA